MAQSLDESEFLKTRSLSCCNHGGIPVGALNVPSSKMKDLLGLLKQHVGKRNNRCIQKRKDGSLIVHLLPESVCFVQDELEGKMKEFFDDSRCRFYPGKIHFGL